jgi:hypothetical protein
MSTHSPNFITFLGDTRTYVQLLQKKNGNYQNKINTFLQFSHSVKPSYER